LNNDLGIIDGLFDPATGHLHTGATGEAPKLAPLSHTGITTGNVGLLAVISDTLHTVRVLAAAAGVTLTNANAVAGNPTIGLDLHALTAIAVAVADGDEVSMVDVSASNATLKATRSQFLAGALHQMPREVYVDAGSGGNVTIDLSAGGFQKRIANTNATIAFSNPPATGAFALILEAVNFGAFTITWPASVKWPGALIPVFTTTGTDIVVFISRDGGTTYYATIAMQDVR
jgi:hypothetical protein